MSMAAKLQISKCNLLRHFSKARNNAFSQPVKKFAVLKNIHFQKSTTTEEHFPGFKF